MYRERGRVGMQWGGMLVGRELSNHCESFIFNCDMSPYDTSQSVGHLACIFLIAIEVQDSPKIL